MVCKDITEYLDVEDKFRVKIREWAEQDSPGHFKCNVCPKPTKHRKAWVSLDNSKRQATIEDTFKSKDSENDEISTKANELEIALCALFAKHDIPFAFIECLDPLLKKYVPDSKIISKMSMGKDKVSYITGHGLGKEYEKLTISKLKNSVCFAVSIDESEVNKHNKLEVVVNVASREGKVETLHYTTLDLVGSDASTIYETLVDKFVEDGIDYHSKLIQVATDGCNTMIGVRNGVTTKFQETVNQCYFTGSCNGHNLGNTLGHAVDAFDPDIKNMLVDIYEDLGGAKGKGTKKMKEFEEFCLNRGVVAQPFKKFISVRFRVLRTCIAPVLEQFEDLVAFYSQVKKPTERQKRLQAMIVDRADITRLELKFLSAATLDITEKIDFFEKNGANIHNAPTVLENILVDQMRKLIDETELTTLDEDTNKVELKSRSELVDLDVKNAKILRENSIFIGKEASKEIKQLGLKPSDKQLQWFYKRVIKFHQVAIQYLQKYFGPPLRSSLMEHFAALGQSKQSHVLTSRSLQQLATKFSKVIENIDPVNGADKIKTEIKAYYTDADVKCFEGDLEYDKYWLKVGEISEGAEGWKRYEILPLFAIALSVKFNSNSEVERTFSLMNHIHQNRQRNCISQFTLNSLLHIKSNGSKICNKCQSISTPHCHCSSVEITENLRAECKKARVKYAQYLQDQKAEKEDVSDDMKARRKVIENELASKLEKRKEKL